MSAPGIVIEIGGGRPARVAQCVLPDVAPLLRGKAAAQAAYVVRRLHAICAEAQGSACEQAVARAAGRDASEARGSEARLRDGVRRLHAEAMRETGLRFCLDWPELVGEAPRLAEARTLNMATRREPLDPAALSAWAEQLVASGLPARIIAAAPAPLASWFAARLADLQARPDLMKRAELAALSPSEPGEGRAEVSTARGPLVHAVRIADGVLADYRIETPTAARFAPGKDADRLLAQCHDAGSVRWVMQALDPCVGWQMKEAA